MVFKKRYDDLWLEWLGGIAVLKHRSKILGEQLGTHLDQLVALGFLRSYALAPAEGRDGFVLTFRAGARFQADCQTFYARRGSGQARFAFDDEEKRDIGSAHQVAYLFQEKLTGRKSDASTYVSSKDVEMARELLQHVSLTAIPDFLDYALREAGTTRFDVRTLGGIRQYLNGYTRRREQREASQKNAAAKREAERQRRLQDEYEEYRIGEAQRILEALPASERASLEARARQCVEARGSTPPFMLATLTRREMLRLVSEAYADIIKSFETWSA